MPQSEPMQGLRGSSWSVFPGKCQRRSLVGIQYCFISGCRGSGYHLRFCLSSPSLPSSPLRVLLLTSLNIRKQGPAQAWQGDAGWHVAGLVWALSGLQYLLPQLSIQSNHIQLLTLFLHDILFSFTNIFSLLFFLLPYLDIV